MARSALAPPDLDAIRATWLSVYAEVLRAWLAEGRPLRLPLSGASMEPMVDGEARIVVERSAAAALRIGDVLLYEQPPHLVCHRVLRRRHTPQEWSFLTKGDGLRVPSTWVPAPAVIGRVTAIEREDRCLLLESAPERVRALAAVGRSWLVLLAWPILRAIRRAVRRAASPRRPE